MAFSAISQPLIVEQHPFHSFDWCIAQVTTRTSSEKQKRSGAPKQVSKIRARNEDVHEVEGGSEEEELQLDESNSMLELKPEVTGLPMCIWISQKHPGRIFVSKRYGDDAEAGDWFVMNFEDMLSGPRGSSDDSESEN
ncbi:hypothetical protein KFL_000780160 [Klebsormidium nitens]|uniref:Uncharacterized protein n=1 Tax=Klebsormidium nitens TaxID=105231 RepID=A0A1Y1HRU7_KLENI|nr:hypothetical protein KFL_000780160 [Klebsormidium nitens]|eukprot:GAQ81354.1 hypothetical protein KFL_000780160 [Klebsormidium nitens]